MGHQTHVITKKKSGRPAFRNWKGIPAAAINTAEGKTRHSFILKIKSIHDLKELAKVEGRPIGETLELAIEDRKRKHQNKVKL